MKHTRSRDVFSVHLIHLVVLNMSSSGKKHCAAYKQMLVNWALQNHRMSMRQSYVSLTSVFLMIYGDGLDLSDVLDTPDDCAIIDKYANERVWRDAAAFIRKLHQRTKMTARYLCKAKPREDP